MEFLILGVLTIWLGFALRSTFRKKGGCGCSGNCACCKGCK